MSFSRPTFRARTALTLTLVGALILVVLSWRVLSHMHYDQEDALVVRTQSVGALFAVTAKDAVAASDLAALQMLTKEIVELPGIVYARVRDIDNHILATSGQAPDPALLNIADAEVDDADDGVFDRTTDIAQGAVKLGRIEIGVSVDEMYVAFREHAIGVAAFSAAALFIVAVCSYLFAALLVRPLSRLRDGAARIADGEFGHTLPVSGHDEIATTAVAFNRMSSRLRELIQEQSDQHRITELIRNAQSEFIGNANDVTLFGNLLAKIVELTQSEVGFLGSVEASHGAAPPMKTLAFTAHGQIREAYAGHPEIQRALASVTPPDTQPTATLAGDETLPHWSTLYVPLANGNMQLGVIVLAKRSDYSQDSIPRLRNLWSALTALIHAARGEQHRRQVERDLAASEQRTRALLDNVIDGIISIDLKGTIVECNPAAEKLFGYARRELMGKNVKILMPDPSRSAHDGYLTQYVKTGVAGIVGIGREVRALRKDGSEFPMHLGISVVRNEQGPSAYIGVVRDISAQKETEEALAHARDVALWTNEAKSHFLATISHELRTPMHGVLGMLDLVHKTQLADQQKKFIEAAQRSGHHLLDIINDVLDLSKLESGQVDVVNKPFNLAALITEATLDLNARAATKGIIFEKIIDSNLPEHLSGDRQKLRQILVNLAGNAIKFTDSGKVTLRIGATHSGTDAVTLRGEVEDTGIGITPEAARRLFTPFQQGDTTTTRRFGGTGLGLAICKQLAEAMGGAIGLTSTPGVGSLFWFTARVRPCDSSDTESVPALPEPTTTPTSLPLRGRVLLAEDDPVNQEVALTMLQVLGITVDIASNGQKAFAMCQSNTYDAVLMDCQMPDLDGFETTRLIRDFERMRDKKRVPIIALTAHALHGDAEMCIASGMDDYISKPFSAADLRAKIAPLLREETAPALPQTPDIGALGAADLERLQALHKMLGARFRELVEKFEDNTRVILERMQSATETSNTEELMRAAHSLKGSSGTIGATAIFKVSSALEEAARQGPVDDAAATVAQLRAEYVRFHNAVEQLKQA